MRGKNQQARTHVSLTCAGCGRKFSRPRGKVKAQHVTVCSFVCYSKVRGSGKFTYRPPIKNPPVIFTCETCGQTVEIPTKRRGARRFRFCSVNCANKGNSGENNHFWRGGHLEYYGSNWRAAQRAARQRDGYSCRRCGKQMKPPGRLPDVHHIKPFRTFAVAEEANTLVNLISLCHTCHMTVEWNGIDFKIDKSQTRLRAESPHTGTLRGVRRRTPQN
jgi:5-methylcytosine-specific restriction endonuclease McrA